MKTRASEKRAVALSVFMLVASACVLAWTAFAQEAKTKVEPPVLRITTHLVLVSAIVQDKQGNPVTDLNKDDFIVLERGKEQTISTFSVESSRMLPSESTPLPPNTFSNRLATRSGIPTSIAVILLDGLNTAVQDQIFAREKVVKFLDQIQPQDRMAIYALTRSEIRVIHDFTSDTASLLALLKRYRGAIPEPLETSIPQEELTGIAAFDAFLIAANRPAATFYMSDRVLRTAAALEALANHLGRFPGRKSLIWVSSSFPISMGMDPGNVSNQRRSFYSETDRSARALSNANVTIYPVDARGLMAPFASAASGRIGTPDGTTIQTGLEGWRETVDAMQILAERTGGRAFYNRNDIEVAVRNAMDDSRVSYVLGYYPSHGKWDGRFVELTLKVKRPGLHVRARAGYFAETGGNLDDKQAATVLAEAAASPLDATSIGLTVRAEAIENGGKKILEVDLQVDSRDITLQRDADRWVGALDLYLGQRSAEGAAVSNLSQRIGMRLKNETYEEIMQKGAKIHRNLELDSSTSQVRVVVRDTLSGAIGSVAIPIGKVQAKPSVSPRSSPPR